MSGFYNGVPYGGMTLLYRLIGADFNSTGDQALVKLHAYPAWFYQGVFVINPSISLTTAAGGLYTGAGKTGNALVAASQAYSTLNATNTGLNLTITAVGRGRQVADPIFALTTAQGAAATADIYIMGFAVL